MTSGTPASALEIVKTVQTGRFEIQGFCPLANSIDWELGQLYWEKYGCWALTGSDVPFLVNNDGNLSGGAADLLFTGLAEAEREGRLENKIFALELGVGLGLFARYFLDEFRRLCAQHEKDYYERLCYVAADKSERMLADFSRHGLLERHEGHYRLCRADALQPDAALAIPAAGEPPGAFRAVLLNYILDNLPAAILKADNGQLSQCCLRTCLQRGVNLSEYTALSPEEIARRAASSHPEDKYDLIDLYPLFAGYLGETREVREGAWGR